MSRLIAAAAALAAAAILAGAASADGTINGYVTDQFGNGVHEVRVYLQPQGGGDFAFGYTDPYGRYFCQGLLEGTWTAYCSRAWSWRSRVKSGINVTSSGWANGDITLGADFQVEEILGSGSYTSFGQTFRALGDSIVEVGVSNDWATNRVYRITVYDGPGGTQIGPSRQTPSIGKGGTGDARWISDEIPVIPGKIYYVEAVNASGGDCGPLVASEDPYPDGVAYFNGTPNASVDIHFIVGSDDDGTVVSYNYPFVGDGSLGTWSNEIGQTFVAKGTSLAGVDCKITVGWGEYLSADLAILDGGPGGAQIGPTKTFGETSDWGHGWAFEPGEVPLTPGHTYYLKITRTPPDVGLNYYATWNQYPNGQLYLNGTAQPYYDLVAHILEYNDQPTFSIYNINFTNPWVDRVDVTWNTTVASTSQVEYWEDGSSDPHTHTDVDENLVTSHSVTIDDLQPGHTYRVVVKSFRRGYVWAKSPEQLYTFTLPDSGTVAGHVYDEDGYPLENATVTLQPYGYNESTDQTGYYEIQSVPAGTYDVTAQRVGYKDFTFEDQVVTGGHTTTVDFNLEAWSNLLTNPSFETGSLSPWVSFGSIDGLISGEWFGGITARTGDYFLGAAANGGTKDGGVYQRVQVRPGAEYQGQAFCRIYRGGNPWDAVRVRVGIDPYGGTNYGSGNVQWSDWNYNMNEWESHYFEVTTPRVTAAGSYVTLFIQHDQKYSDGWHINADDDAAVYGPKPYSHSTSPAGWLSAGWNLMSLPLDPADPAVTSALDDLIAAGNDVTNSLYTYDGTYTIYPSDFTQVARGKAYWLLLTVGAQENLTGEAAEGDVSIPLREGWCFVGHPKPDPCQLADVSFSDGVTTKSFDDAAAAGWVDPTLYYYDGSYMLVRTDGTGDDDSLRPWYGYWLLTYQSGLEMIVP